ncbi:MAG: amidohydrolase family protein [Propionibacteriales bacterium]|nr:amidohydrolase family protein [Propionibacteriales bacterium]
MQRHSTASRSTMSSDHHHGGPLIDCDVHLPTPTVDQLGPYLSEHWREYIATAGFKGSMAVTSTHPPGARSSGHERLDGGFAEAMRNVRRHCLGESESARAVVSAHYGVETMGPPDFSTALSRAVNDWMLTACRDTDERLLASINVPPQYPDLAAEEIDRLAGDDRVVQVFVPARTSKPYGNRIYYPLLAAAERNGLPLGIHFGGMSWNPPTGVGWPSYYIEEYVGMAHVMQAQLSSLVFEGAFQRFPRLRVTVLEGGWTWLPSLMWRLDKEWKGIRREVPWVEEPPSTYLRRHVKLSIQPIDAPPDGPEVMTTIDQIGSDDVLMYASDFPHEHLSDPLALLDRLAPETASKVAYGNAAACYGVPSAPEPQESVR